MNTDVMQIIEILSVESSERKHRGSDKPCAMSPSGSWSFSRYFQLTNCVTLKISHQDIVQIVTETATENVNFIIVY